MTASDVKKLKELEPENRKLKLKLKLMFADLSLKHEALKDIVEKIAPGPAERRELVDHAREAYGLSERSACEVAGISRSVYHYRPNERKDNVVIEAIQSVVERYPAYGFSKVFTVLRREGHPWSTSGCIACTVL
jgi:putative transposase